MNHNYSIKYTDRKKLRLSIERDKSIVVYAPRQVSEEQIGKFVESKKLWLYQKLKQTQNQKNITQRKEYVSGSSVLYLGNDYRIDIVPEEFPGIKFDNIFMVAKKNANNINDLLINWFKEEVKNIMIPRVELHSKSMGIIYNKIIFSSMKVRWGSCTPSKNLNFNWRLIKAPINVIDYVIVHELAHIMVSTHSATFWNIISVQIPDYLKAKNWLKENGSLLEID